MHPYQPDFRLQRLTMYICHRTWRPHCSQWNQQADIKGHEGADISSNWKRSSANSDPDCKTSFISFVSWITASVLLTNLTLSENIVYKTMEHNVFRLFPFVLRFTFRKPTKLSYHKVNQIPVSSIHHIDTNTKVKWSITYTESKTHFLRA